MRFVCDSCRAQYMISDEKVGAKGVKVRCKKCGFVILVRRADTAQPVVKPPLPPPDLTLSTQVVDNPLHGPTGTLPEMPASDPGVAAPGGDAPSSLKDVFGGANEDEIGAVFDQVLNSGAHKVDAGANGTAQAGGLSAEVDDDNRMSTRVIDVDMVKKLAAESEQEQSQDQAGGEKAPKAEVAAYDWFVAIDEKQTGPLSVEKIKDYWNRGEIGPDSLCWRAGFGDWTALSEVPELAAVLAPRPGKPVIVSPAPVSNLGPVVTVPIESAFSAGGITKTVRSEVQVSLAASAPGEEISGWKPSAASALASLAKADIAALSKPKVSAEVPALDLGKGLLDLPDIERTNGHSKANGTAHAKSAVPDSAESSRPGGALYPLPGGATFTSPGFTTYKPPSRKGLYITLGGLGLIVVLGLVTAIVYFATRPPVYPYYPPGGPGQPLAMNPDPGLPPVRVVAPGQPVQPSNTSPVTPANPATVSPPVNPTPPAVASSAPSGGRTHRGQGKSGSGKAAQREPTPPPPTAVAAVAPPVAPDPPPRPMEREPSGDDFDKEFGGSSSSKGEPKGGEKQPAKGGKSVYIPPAPGAMEVQASLGQSDIMQVVLSNRAGLSRCAEEQKKKEPGVSGKLVMKWTIHPSGRTSAVSVVSTEFKATPMASCVGGLIKSWTFPKHKTQGEPVVFPFKF